jgi:DNA polymerase-3 subunit delta
MKEAEGILLDLKRKIYKPVYFFCGEEPYFIDMLSDYMEAHILDEGEREFNQSVVYGKDLTLSDVLTLARQFPMMGERKVVLVKEAQNLKDLGKGGASEEESGSAKSSNDKSEQLLRYLENPQKETILVFCYKHKTFDKRTRLGKSMQKHAVFLETKRIYENKVPDWVSGYVQQHGHKMSPPAAFLIAEYLGNDLGKIANELDKLFINIKEKNEIDVDAVQKFIGISREYNVFELQDAFSKRDVMKANRIINYFAANEKDAPLVMLLSTLYGYFTKILRLHNLQDRSKGAAAQALGVNPYFVDGFMSAAQYYPPPKLRQIFSYLKEYDLKSKGVESTGVPDGELMKELVYKILH